MCSSGDATGDRTHVGSGGATCDMMYVGSGGATCGRTHVGSGQAVLHVTGRAHAVLRASRRDFGTCMHA